MIWIIPFDDSLLQTSIKIKQINLSSLNLRCVLINGKSFCKIPSPKREHGRSAGPSISLGRAPPGRRRDIFKIQMEELGIGGLHVLGYRTYSKFRFCGFGFQGLKTG